MTVASLMALASPLNFAADTNGTKLSNGSKFEFAPASHCNPRQYLGLKSFCDRKCSTMLSATKLQLVSAEFCEQLYHSCSSSRYNFSQHQNIHNYGLDNVVMLNEPDNPNVGFYICVRSTEKKEQKVLYVTINHWCSRTGSCSRWVN